MDVFMAPTAPSPLRRRRVGALLALTVWVATPPGPASSFPFYSLAALRRGTSEVPPPPAAVVVLSVARYGPPPTPIGPFSDPAQPEIGGDHAGGDKAKRRDDFRHLVETVAAADDASHVPSLLTRHMDAVLSVLTDDGDGGGDAAEWLESLVCDAQVRHGNEAAHRTAQALEAVLACAEEFVAQARSLGEDHKALLGRILRLVSDRSSSSSSSSSSDREDALDRLLDDERDRLTPGFLRHLEGECRRIESAPRLTPESARLLELLCVIRARVVEELGRDLGEAARMLGELVACDDPAERQALVDATIAVRGAAFARELSGAANEALEGFGRAAGELDPGLVQRVEEIRNWLQYHLPRQPEGRP